MALSIILAWLTVFFCLLAGFKWVTRVTGWKTGNRLFHSIHIPFGLLALATGLLHGLLAGNPVFATLSDFDFAPELFTLNLGSICFISVLLLAISYLSRKKLKKHWMPIHRTLTALTLVLLLLHLFDMGISLPSLIFQSDTSVDTAVFEESALAPEQSDASSAFSIYEPLDVPELSSAIPSSVEAFSSSNEEVLTESIEEPESPLVTFSGAVLEDGSYTGSAEGFRGPITLTVTVLGGQVTDITVDANSDTPRFFDYALGITDTIVTEQSLEVDAISGATFSSVGIMNAVYDALQSAVTDGTLSITEIDLSAIPHGHGH